MSEWQIIFLIGLTVFFTFSVEGIAGFGSTVMALPFVVMMIGLKDAVPLLSSLNLLLAAFLIFRSWRSIIFREYFFIVANVIAGVGAGLIMMDRLPQNVMILILCVFTLFVGVRGLVNTLKHGIKAVSTTAKKKDFISCFILFLGGIFQGAFSSGGPLVVMYAAKAIPEKTMFRATLPLLWLTTNLTMNIKWLVAGDVWDKQLFMRYLWSLPFVVGGMLLGDYLHWKVDQKKFTLLVYSLLIIVGTILGIRCFF